MLNVALPLLVLCFQSAPATRPDTPAEAAAREAALHFAEALLGTDPDVIKASFAGGEDELACVLALNKLLRAQAHLREAAIAKLPAHGGSFGSGPDQKEQARMSVLAWPLKIAGDHATIFRPDGQIGYTLVQKDGVWRVEFMPSLTNLRAMLPTIDPTCRAINEVADELAAGKYATEGEVRQAIGERAKAMMAGAATRPAGKP